MGEPRTIGVRALAVLTRGSDLLVLAPRDRAEVLEFPGSAPRVGETLEDSLQDELRRGVGIDAHVGRLISVIDHIRTETEEPRHDIEFYFIVRLENQDEATALEGRTSKDGLWTLRWVSRESESFELLKESIRRTVIGGMKSDPDARATYRIESR